MRIQIKQAKEEIMAAQKITFLTGAGVSTLSGIPDYRSMTGVYHNLDAPEYLLSHDCLKNEPEKFYNFVKHLYHPEAQPNVIHRVMAALEKKKEVTVVTQNIDDLHRQAGSHQLVEFHGSLYRLHCQKCHQEVSAVEYLQNDHHQNCGGIIRPEIVLYGEGIDVAAQRKAVNALAQADLVVIVGTSFKVYPFAGLIDFVEPEADILVINHDPIQLNRPFNEYVGQAENVFKSLAEGGVV